MSRAQVGPPPSPQLFFETVNAFHKTEALKTAIELGLFTGIAQGQQIAEDIAATCNASARGTRILCDFLVVNGFLTKAANRYGVTRPRISRQRTAILAAALNHRRLQAPYGSGTHRRNDQEGE